MSTCIISNMRVTHPDAGEIDRMIKAYERGALFKEFTPVDNYWHQCSGGVFWRDVALRTSDNALIIRFDTRSRFPREFFEELVSQGFEVETCCYDAYGELYLMIGEYFRTHVKEWDVSDLSMHEIFKVKPWFGMYSKYVS